MKILWIDLNSSYAHASLALPALHAQVMKHNPAMVWESVQGTINDNLGHLAETAARHEADIVAATAWLFTHEALLHVVARVKALRPQSTVILGGPEFLGGNEAYLRSHPYVDCVFRGEGEEAFPLWLEHYAHREEWHGIPGLCYLDADGHYHDNGTARALHFEQLALPEESPFFRRDKPFVQIETTRGCFNTCAFCVSGGEKPVRVLPLETVRRKLDMAHRCGVRDVRVLDRTFNYNPRRACQMLGLFKEYAPAMRFHLEIHPALLGPELREALQAMPTGCLHLEAGIQSLRDEVLQASGRHGGVAESLEGLRFLCAQPNLQTHADLIAGLPLYSLPQMLEDIRTLVAMNVDELQLESLKVLPGTAMRRRAAELGIAYSPLPPYEVLRTPCLSTAELQRARLISRLIDGFYNARPWQALTRSLILKDEGFIPRLLDYLMEHSLADQPLSLEKRGLLLHDFIATHYPAFATQASVAWIEAGMSLKKAPAQHVETRRLAPPRRWDVQYGNYREELRLCFLPDAADDGQGYWFGFDPQQQPAVPVFKAYGSRN